MTKEEKELLLKDLCARLPYGVQVCVERDKYAQATLLGVDTKQFSITFGGSNWSGISNIEGHHIEQYKQLIKPYLRPLPSMTEEEAMKIAELWGLKDILSVSVKENYISIEVDDGVVASETYTIWFKEIVSSIELLDWLNAHHFDYRGLIEKGVAIAAPKGIYNN